jgi:F-type H+-transporting ATPase subunit b
LVLLALAGNSIQLVPDGTLIFHVLLIIAMVALVNGTLLRPINRILEERDRRTKGRLTEAEMIQQSVQEKFQEYDRRLKEARAEGYALMERERTALSTERQRRVADTKAEVGLTLSEQKLKLETEVGEAKRKLASSARTSALEIAGQILQRRISE